MYKLSGGSRRDPCDTRPDGGEVNVSCSCRDHHHTRRHSLRSATYVELLFFVGMSSVPSSSQITLESSTSRSVSAGPSGATQTLTALNYNQALVDGRLMDWVYSAIASECVNWRHESAALRFLPWRSRLILAESPLPTALVEGYQGDFPEGSQAWQDIKVCISYVPTTLPSTPRMARSVST